MRKIFAALIAVLILMGLLVGIYFFISYSLSHLQEGTTGLILLLAFYGGFALVITGIFIYGVYENRENKTVVITLTTIFLVMILVLSPLVAYPLLDLIHQEKLVLQGPFKIEKYRYRGFISTNISMKGSQFYFLMDRHLINEDTATFLRKNSREKVEMEYFKYSGVVNKIEILE